MGCAIIFWGRFLVDGGTEKITVPAPSTDKNAVWLWDLAASYAKELSQTGFTAIQLPPAQKCQGGAGVGDDGYGVFDPYDLGTKNQQGSIPTRYGTGEQLRRLIAISHANGLQVYLDIVLHQRIGSNGGNGIYEFVGSDGKTLNGRGKTSPGWFRGGSPGQPIPPFCKEDDVPVPSDDFAFGDELSFQNCNPPRVTVNFALDYGNWLFKTTDADGARFDDTKGTWAPFVREFMTTGVMASKFFYSEYFDGNPANLNWWATTQPMSGRSLVEDFTIHWAIQSACISQNPQVLNGAGYTSWNPFLACTFVDNPDTDTSYGEDVPCNKLLAYAYLMTIEGYPFVYGKDYFGNDVWPGAYGLKPWIDNLVWIHENFANGNTVTQHVDNNVIVFNRTGFPGLLTGLNFNNFENITITCPTSFGPNVHLHDYTGHAPDVWTNSNGEVTITIPKNAYQSGQSYVCYSVPGYNSAINLPPKETTQVFFGAADLDIPPIAAGTIKVARIWCAQNTHLQWDLGLYTAPTGTEKIVLVLTDPTGANLLDTAGGFKIVNTGWHTIEIAGDNMPTDATFDFELSVTYTATRTLTKDQFEGL